MTKNKRAGSVVMTGIIVLFTVMLFMLSVPLLFGFKLYYVSTGSMEKTIKQGSMVVVEKVDFKDIKVRDILTFEGKGKNSSFTHRVVEINEEYEYFLTKGDASEVNDPKPTKYEHVVGRVVYSISYVGFLPKLMDSTIFRIIVGAVYILWISLEIENYKTNRRKAGGQS
ncbi:MAG TPA: signal peptidase I [Clostridia bacterium]|nr:signal peptidase I [Clostridia bacterium]